MQYRIQIEPWRVVFDGHVLLWHQYIVVGLVVTGMCAVELVLASNGCDIVKEVRLHPVADKSAEVKVFATAGVVSNAI